MDWVPWVKWAIAVMGVLLSLFYGVLAVQIFWFPKTNNPENRVMRCIRWASNAPMNPNGERFTFAALLHQFWLNLVGSAFGWLLIFVVFSDLTSSPHGLTWSRVMQQITPSHVVMSVVGVIGIVGWLPMTLLGVVNSFGALVKAVLEWVKGKT